MTDEFSAEARALKPGTYKHFKGPLYEVFFVVKHSESGEEFVVYSPKGKDSKWARPLTMFTEHIERDGYNGPRFTYVEQRL